MSTPYPVSIFSGPGSISEPILSANLVAVRAKVRRVSLEIRWALAGLLLAQVMVVLLYLVLVDNIAQVQNKRLAHEQQVRERHRCAMLQDRLEREQCLAALLLGTPLDVATALAQR